MSDLALWLLAWAFFIWGVLGLVLFLTNDRSDATPALGNPSSLD
jgi:hypothetical protein